MPRATKFLKEDIIEAASAVVKKEGLSAINARRVAKELGCSVQPIFYQFENMEDLKALRKSWHIGAWDLRISGSRRITRISSRYYLWEIRRFLRRNLLRRIIWEIRF